MMLNQILRYTSQILLALFLILVSFDFNSHEFQFKLTLHIRLSSLKPTRASIKQKKYRNKFHERNLFRSIIFE